MKRDLDSDASTKDNLLYLLPDDIIVEILRFVTNGFLDSITEMAATTEKRLISKRLKVVIDREILGRVAEIEPYLQSMLSDSALCLFSGLKCIDDSLPTNLGKVLQYMTALERLNTCSIKKINNSELSRLTTLTNLSFSGPNCNVDDAVLAQLYQLKHLDIGTNAKIEGSCLKQLTNLTKLVIDCSIKLSEPYLDTLAASLCVLNIVYPHFSSRPRSLLVSDVLLTKLTNLHTLSIQYENTVTNKGLTNLTQLTSLDLRYNDYVTDDALFTLTQLKELRLDWVPYITNKGLDYLADSLVTLDMAFLSDIDFYQLTRLTKLKEVLVRPNPLDTIYQDPIMLLRKRGVEVYTDYL